MKIKILIILLFLSCHFCYATTPYPDKTVQTSDKNISVRLTTRRGLDTAILIEDKQGRTLKTIKESDLNLDYKSELATAGNDWYQNSIAFINKSDNYFVLRLRWNKILVIDLKTKTLINAIPKELSEEIKDTLYQRAIKLLSSDNPKDKQTGAIVCGQMNIRNGIPKLKELLSDEAYYSQQSGESPWRTVYVVRKAAKEALESMGEIVSGVIIEKERDK